MDIHSILSDKKVYNNLFLDTIGSVENTGSVAKITTGPGTKDRAIEWHRQV